MTALVQPELTELVQESSLADRVCSFSQLDLDLVRELEIDRHLPIMNLGRVLGLDPLQLPGGCPYFQVSPQRLQRSRQIVERLSAGTGPRVGLVWSGSSDDGPKEIQKAARRRNFPLHALRPALEVPGIRFFSLQKGFPALARLEFPWITELPLSDSFADTAAFLKTMDALITVDTSIAHVAGALGVPVLMLDRYDSCWRWGRNPDAQPWYPSLRIFRQTDWGDWSPVVERIRLELLGLARKH